MAADGIIGQRRAAGVRIDDLAKRNEAQLNERLETVTDTAYQAVALFQRACTCSRIEALRKNAVINLPEPSGSSPPEKPPE